MVIDEKENSALTIIARLRAAGFTAVLAGGCVRDRILGVTPKDYDIATDARPEAVQALVRRLDLASERGPTLDWSG